MSKNIQIVPPIQRLSEMQISAVKKARVISRPTGAALEYHAMAINPWKGCGFQCTYCYVPAASFMSRAKHDTPPVTLRKKNYLALLSKDLDDLAVNGLRGSRIFCSFLSDPWNPGEDTNCHIGEIIDLIHSKGYFICTLTKSGEASLISIDKFMPGDQYAASLTCLSLERSREWEPEAATPESRIEALKVYSAKLGKENVWVSLEPVLYAHATLELIKLTHPFVGLFKVGKVTANKQAKEVNWWGFGRSVVNLCSSLEADIFIKSSLHQYIPDIMGAKITYYHSGEWLSLGCLNFSLRQIWPKSRDYVNALIAMGNGGVMTTLPNGESVEFRINQTGNGGE